MKDFFEVTQCFNDVKKDLGKYHWKSNSEVFHTFAFRNALWEVL